MVMGTRRAVAVRGRRGIAVAGLVAVSSASGLAGCGIVNSINKAVHDVENNKALINTFTTTLESTKSMAFEATYITTDSPPVTVIYAVDPPKDLAFEKSSSGSGSEGNGSGSVRFISNGSGEYSCAGPTSSGQAWSCKKLGHVEAAVQKAMVDIYTPSHWVDFLEGSSIVAGLAGDKVTSSTMTVHGFNLNCVNLRVTGTTGKSTICTTSQGVLGYAKVMGEKTAFEIEAFTSTPSASLFGVPPGAEVTTSSY
jgi:hypothetical protein